MANEKFNFKKEGIDIEGEPMKDAGKAILLSDEFAKTIMYSMITDPDKIVKYFGWGNDLKKTGVLTLDKTDKETLQGFIKTNPQMAVILKGQLLECLDTPVK